MSSSTIKKNYMPLRIIFACINTNYYNSDRFNKIHIINSWSAPNVGKQFILSIAILDMKLYIYFIYTHTLGHHES